MKLETHINGSLKIFLIPENDLDKEILKRINEQSQIEVAGSGSAYYGKALQEGAIIISEHEKAI
jgi:hypothetical protein